MFRAVLDTCTLWPSLQCDLLLTMASHRLYEPLWSDITVLELEFHEARKLEKISHLSARDAEDRARRLIQQMNIHFPDAMVRDTDLWTAPDFLPDENDAHVIAAAELGHAGAIVTDNLQDFPSAAVPDGVDVLSPRDFLADTVGIDPALAYRATMDLIGRRQRPAMSFDEVLSILEDRYRAKEAVELLLLGRDLSSDVG